MNIFLVFLLVFLLVFFWGGGFSSSHRRVNWKYSFKTRGFITHPLVRYAYDRGKYDFGRLPRESYKIPVHRTVVLILRIAMLANELNNKKNTCRERTHGRQLLYTAALNSYNIFSRSAHLVEKKKK